MVTTRMFFLIAMLLLALEGAVGEAATKKDADTKKDEAAAKKDADKKAEEAAAKKDAAEKKAEEAAAKKDEQELAKRKAAEKAAAKKDADKKAEEAAAKKDAAEKKAEDAAAKKDEQELAKRKAAEKAAAKKDADKKAEEAAAKKDAAGKKAEEAAAKKDEQELAKRKAAEKAAAKKDAEELQKRQAAEKAAAAKKAAQEAAVKKAAAAAAAKAAAAAAATTAAPAAKIAIVVEKPVAPVRRHLVLAVADVEAFIADASELLLVTKAIAGSLGVTTAQVRDVRITQAAAPTVSGSRLRRLTAGSVDVAFTCFDCRQGTCQEKGLLGSLAAGAQKVTSATCLPQKPPCVPVLTTITTTPAPPVQTDAPCGTVGPTPVVSSDPCATQAKKFSQGAAVHLGSKALSSGMLWLAVPALLGMILLVRAVSIGRCRVPDACSAEDARSMTTLLEEVPLGEHEARNGEGLAMVEAIRFSSTEAVEFLE